MDYEAARLTPVSNPSSLNYSDSFGSMSSFNNSSPYSARNQQQQQQQQQQQPHQSSNSKPNGLLGKMFRKGQPKHPKLKPAGISSKDYFANEDLYSTNTTPAPSQQQQQQQQQHQPLPATDYYEAPKGVKLTQKLSGFSAFAPNSPKTTTTASSSVPGSPLLATVNASATASHPVVTSTSSFASSPHNSHPATAATTKADATIDGLSVLPSPLPPPHKHLKQPAVQHSAVLAHSPSLADSSQFQRWRPDKLNIHAISQQHTPTSAPPHTNSHQIPLFQTPQDDFINISATAADASPLPVHDAGAGDMPIDDAAHGESRKRGSLWRAKLGFTNMRRPESRRQRHQSFDQTAVDITAHPHMYPESPLVSPPPPPLPPPPPAGTWRRTAANIHTARHQQHAEGVAKSPGARHMPSAAAPPPDAQACEISESSVSSSSLTDTTLPAEVVNVANLGNIDKDFLLTIQKNSALEARRQRRREMRRKTMSFLNTSAATACEQSWATSPTSSAATSAAASRKNKSVFVGRANDRAAAATDDDDIRGHLSQKHHQQQQHGLPSSLDSPTIAAEFNHAAVDEIRLPSSEPPRAATAAAVAVSHANAENDIITPPHSHNMEATNNSSNVCKSHALQGSAAQRDRHHIANNGEAVDGRTLTTNSSTTSLRSHAAPGKTASIMHAHGLAAAPPPKTPATEDGPDNSCGIERSKLEAASNASSSIGNTHGSKDGLQLHSFSQKHKLDAASPVQRKAMLSDTDAAGATRNVVPPIPPLPPHVVSYSQVHSSPSSARSSPASSRPSTAGGRDSSSQPAPYSAPINAYDDMALHTPRAAMYGHSAGEWDAQMRKLQEYNISPHSARPQLGIVTNFVSPTSSIISINSGSATAVPDSGDNCGYHSIHSIMQASSTTAQSHQSYLQQQQQQRPSLATGLRKFSQPNAQLHDNSQSLLSPVGSPEFMSKSAANLHLRASVDDRVSGAGRLLSPTSPTRRMPLCKTQSEHGDLGAAKYSTLSKTTSHNDAPVVASLVGDPMARRKIRDQLASSTAFDRLLEEDGEFTMAISLTPKVAGHAAISTSRSTKAPAHLFKKWK